MSSVRYLVGDVFERMAELPDGSVDLVVTSPPFLALRSYLPADHPSKHLEIGSEATPAAFLSTLLRLTAEWRRLLTPHGSICVELGDTYSGSGGAGGDYGPDGLRNGQPKFRQMNGALSRGNSPKATAMTATVPVNAGPGWPLAKSLCLIPSLYAASLAYGRNLLDADDEVDAGDWRVRNLIVWHRPNPPVGALGDKVRPSTSYVTVACVSKDRWFDLDAERMPAIDTNPRTTNGTKVTPDWHDDRPGRYEERVPSNAAGAPPLDCWTIPTAPYSGSHYATFPPALPRRLINLMCPRQICLTCGEPRRRLTSEPEYVSLRGSTSRSMSEGTRRAEGVNQWTADDGTNGSGWARQTETLGWSDCGHNTWRRGIVLDPFGGSGTTGQAAAELGRDSLLIDLDERNLDLARQRCGMFLTEDDEVPA